MFGLIRKIEESYAIGECRMIFQKKFHLKSKKTRQKNQPVSS